MLFLVHVRFSHVSILTVFGTAFPPLRRTRCGGQLCYPRLTTPRSIPSPFPPPPNHAPLALRPVARASGSPIIPAVSDGPLVVRAGKPHSPSVAASATELDRLPESSLAWPAFTVYTLHPPEWLLGCAKSWNAGVCNLLVAQISVLACSSDARDFSR